jgi:hypothetical protein
MTHLDVDPVFTFELGLDFDLDVCFDFAFAFPFDLDRECPSDDDSATEVRQLSRLFLRSLSISTR